MKLASKLAILVFMAGVFMPSAVFALESEDPKPEITVEQQQEKARRLAEERSKSCERFDRIANKLRGNYDSRKSRSLDRLSDKKPVLKDKQGAQKDNIEAKRAQWDAERTERFEKLREKAQTDEHKQAIETYISAVIAAVNARRTATDSARTTYLEGLHTAIESRHSDNVIAATNFKSQIENAVSKAKAACSEGTPYEQVKAALESDIRAAQQTYKERQANATFKEQLRVLREDRKVVVKAAHETFQQAMAQARADLKAAFEAEL